MQFRGTLIEPPPCTINDDGVIDVDFGDRVGINKVDGVNYRQTIGYRITCEPGIGKWDMMLRLNGTATSFDEAAVQTNHRYLGIRICKMPRHSKWAVRCPSIRLAAGAGSGAGRQGGETLTEGAFDATATLQADYQ